MTEQAFLRVGATAMATVASIGLAVTLGATITAWLGWAAFVVVWVPIALKLISAERHRLELNSKATPVENWDAVTADEHRV